MCWTRRHLFQQYKSGLIKFPGGGITTFNFMFRIFYGARHRSLVGPLIVSTVNDGEFSIPSVSAASVNKNSLSSDFPCFERRNEKIESSHCLFICMLSSLLAKLVPLSEYKTFIFPLQTITLF